MPETPPSSERLEALIRRWENEKSAGAFLQLADEYRRLERPADAAKVLAEGLASNPRHPAAKVALGRCRLELGQTAEAVATLESVIADDPTQMVAYRLLVEAHIQRGEAEPARQRLRIYGLLNDSDPEIAELRRRIGQLGTEARTPADAQTETSPELPGSGSEEMPPAPSTAAGSVSIEEPAAPPVGMYPDEPFPELASPGDGERYTTALSSGPFAAAWPTPAPPAAGERPAAAAGAAPASDPFDLGERPAASAPALSELLAPDRIGHSPPVPHPDPSAALGMTGIVEEEALGMTGMAEEEAPGMTRTVEDVAAPPTATLGRLYLRQGHRTEAEAIFRQVLAREPHNQEAREGLEASRQAPRPARRLTAAALLAGHLPEGDRLGLTRRRAMMLERYAERLRGQHVR